MIEFTVAHLGLDRTTNTPVVILREKDGSRVLPIWIGPAEASAIAMELQGMKAQRPLTHDLLTQLLGGLCGGGRRSSPATSFSTRVASRPTNPPPIHRSRRTS